MGLESARGPLRVTAADEDCHPEPRRLPHTEGGNLRTKWQCSKPEPLRCTLSTGRHRRADDPASHRPGGRDERLPGPVGRADRHPAGRAGPGRTMPRPSGPPDGYRDAATCWPNRSPPGRCSSTRTCSRAMGPASWELERPAERHLSRGPEGGHRPQRPLRVAPAGSFGAVVQRLSPSRIRSASGTCRQGWNCDEKIWRTIPSRPIR